MKVMMDYILQHDFSRLMAGRITLDGDDLFINLDEVELKPKEEQRLEFHKGYIDVQLPLLQPETMGWTALSDLGKPDIAYNPTTDCGFYKQAAKEYLKVEPGQFTVFFPEDAHAPIIGEGLQRKLVGKGRGSGVAARPPRGGGGGGESLTECSLLKGGTHEAL